MRQTFTMPITTAAWQIRATHSTNLNRPEGMVSKSLKALNLDQLRIHGKAAQEDKVRQRTRTEEQEKMEVSLTFVEQERRLACPRRRAI